MRKRRLIVVYRVMKGLEKLDRDDLLIKEERLQEKWKMLWNGLERVVVQAKTKGTFMVKLNGSSWND